MRRVLRATKPQERVVQAQSFEVVDEDGNPIAGLGPIPGSEVGERGVGLVLYGPDGSERLTVGVDTTGPAIHLSQDGNVRCSIAVIDAEPGEALVVVAVRDRRGREVASLVAADGLD
jgi:hypothetical protein